MILKILHPENLLIFVVIQGNVTGPSHRNSSVLVLAGT